MRSKDKFVLRCKVSVVGEVTRRCLHCLVFHFGLQPLVQIFRIQQTRSVALIGSPVEHFECANVVEFRYHTIVGISNDAKEFSALVGVDFANRKELAGNMPPTDILGPLSAFGIVATGPLGSVIKQTASPRNVVLTSRRFNGSSGCIVPGERLALRQKARGKKKLKCPLTVKKSRRTCFWDMKELERAIKAFDRLDVRERSRFLGCKLLIEAMTLMWLFWVLMMSLSKKVLSEF